MILRMQEVRYVHCLCNSSIFHRISLFLSFASILPTFSSFLCRFVACKLFPLKQMNKLRLYWISLINDFVHPLMFNCRIIFSSWCTRFTYHFARTRPESMRDFFQITRRWALKYISYIYIWSLHYCFVICLNTSCLISQSEAFRVLECPSYKFLSVHWLDLLNSSAALVN